MADTPLDNLYRDRTSEGLEDTLPGAPTVEEATDDGRIVRVNVQWGEKSFMRIDCTKDTVRFLRLDSGKAGLYGELCEKLPRFFKLRGVKQFEMSPATDESREILLKRGKWEPDGSTFRWVL